MAKSDNLRKAKETTATIMEGVTSLEKSMFFNYPSLTTVNLPDSLTTISETAFMSCGSLTRYEEIFSYRFFPPMLTSLDVEGFSIRDVRIKNPDNPANLVSAKLITYSID